MNTVGFVPWGTALFGMVMLANPTVPVCPVRVNAIVVFDIV